MVNKVLKKFVVLTRRSVNVFIITLSMIGLFVMTLHHVMYIIGRCIIVV